MAGDGSAYAALGLEPGADSRAIEQAYKRLIKQHHPDRQGGDSRRAADINRAYEELRATRGLRAPLELNDEWPGAAPRNSAGPILLLLLAAIGIGLIVFHVPILPGAETSSATPERLNVHGVGPDPMDQSLHLQAIDGSVREAVQLSRTRDEMALAGASRDCHHQLRNDPTLIQLDRCAAFDDAVVALQDRDPLRDQGPFSELAVTGRIWSGATALSGDSVAIDGRLGRIRLRVDTVLAPLAAPSPPQSAN